MVGDQIENYLEIMGMRCREQSVEIRQFAEYRINGHVIGNVVAEIGHRRAEDGREPERIDTKLGEIW